MYESSREKIACFINASPEEIVFVRNATEGINLIACSFGGPNVSRGDNILLTQLEHHSNIVPWQLLAQRKKATLSFAKMSKNFLLGEKDFAQKLNKKTKIASFTAASNVLGTITPVEKLVKLSHEAGAVAVVDAAQAAPHFSLDVKKLDCDFAVFSGHKMLGPTGIGVLYGKKELLEEMPPFLAGGDMIKRVFWQHSEYNDLPYKFEAGTPNISGVIGLGAAVDYLQRLGMSNIRSHEQSLTKYALEELSSLPKTVLYGPPADKRTAAISFNLGGVHPHDVASVVDGEGVAIRSGHHCAMPLMSVLGVAATCRASFYVYNDVADVDALATALRKTTKLFRL